MKSSHSDFVLGTQKAQQQLANGSTLLSCYRTPFGHFGQRRYTTSNGGNKCKTSVMYRVRVKAKVQS
jgi:hypothetical protein